MQRHWRFPALARRGRSRHAVFWNNQCRDAVERAIGVIRRAPLAGGLLQVAGVVLLFTLFAPYRPTLRPFFASRLPRFRETHFYFLRRLPDDVGLRRYPEEGSFVQTLYMWPRLGMGLAAVLAAGTYYVFLPIDLLLGVLPWLQQVCSRLAIWLGLRSAAYTAFGVDMMGTRSDASRTGTLPPEISRAAMPNGLETALVDRLAVAGAPVGSHLRAIAGARDTHLLVEARKARPRGCNDVARSVLPTHQIIAAVADAIVNAPATPQSLEYERMRKAAFDGIWAAAMEAFRSDATVQDTEGPHQG